MSLILVPISPLKPMHESILNSLVCPGSSIRCFDPDEPVAPYLDAMIKAGWLNVKENALGLTPDITISEKGRHQLALIKALGAEEC